LDRAFDYESKG